MKSKLTTGMIFGALLFGAGLGCSEKIPHNESTAVNSLKAISNAQAVFIKTDFYGNGALVYANPEDGRGISDLYEVGFDGTNATASAHKIIDITLARADDSIPNAIPKGGYLFRDLKYDDYSLDHGVFAYPEKYDVTGRKVFILDVTGTIYPLDAKKLDPTLKTGDKITPFDTYPTDKELEKWIPAVR